MTFSSRRFTAGVVLTNLGLLAALISGPNLGHTSPAAQYGGLAVMALGLALMAVDDRPPPQQQQRIVPRNAAMNALRRVWNAFVSVAPMSEQRTFWPLWLIVGSTFGLTAAVPSVRFIAAFTFFAGCFLTLRYISFNGLGFQEFKRK